MEADADRNRYAQEVQMALTNCVTESDSIPPVMSVHVVSDIQCMLTDAEPVSVPALSLTSYSHTFGVPGPAQWEV